MRIIRHPAILVSIAIAALVSCSSFEEAGSADSKLEPGGADRSVDRSMDADPSTESRDAEDGVIERPIDPLAEVARLWNAGRKDDARKRFQQDDVRTLAAGPRRSEWSIWRGKLYTRTWDGGHLGLAGENVSALLVDGDDVWAGTWTGGIARLSEPTGDVLPWDPGMPSLAVRTVNRIRRFEDRIWMVRYGAVERYDLRTSKWTVEADLPARERLQDVYVRDGVTYVATLGDGLWKKDGLDWTRVPEPGLFINRIAEGEGGELLIATMDRGLYVFDPATFSWTRPPEGFLRESNVTSAIASGSHIIGGTYGSGAFAWDRSNGRLQRFEEDRLGDSWILDTAKSSNWVYFATFGAGMGAWNSVTGEWDRFSIADGFPTDDVASVAAGPDGSVWVGTLGGGVVRLDRGVHGD